MRAHSSRGRDTRSGGSSKSTVPLLVIYAICVLLHIWLLWEASKFPHISSDEVQYSSLGESLRVGRGYTIHGEFHSSVPPLYPALIALAHSIGPDPRASMLVVSCFVMCLAVFPVFWIARYLGVGRTASHLLALMAGFLPHTLYAGTYMPETLQYPVFLTAFYLILRWLDHPSLARDLLVGFSLGCAILTKVQGLQLAGAFLLTALVQIVRARKDRGVVSRHVAVIITVTAAMTGAWIAYKTAHNATLLGAGYQNSLNGGLTNWTWRLAAAYFADFLLAPGLITLAPMVIWFREAGRKNFMRAFFVAVTLAIQFAAVSTLDGGLTGWLRERLFLYSLPLMGILAVRGLEHLKDESRRRLAWVCIATCAALLTVLTLYRFQVSSVIEVPWANAMGSIPSGFEGFSRLTLIAISLAAAVAGSLILAFAEPAPAFFAAFLLAFQFCGFAASSKGLAEWARSRQPDIGKVIEWLSADRVPPGSRLLIAGNHFFFEGRIPCAAPDPEFLRRTFALGLTDALEWQIEIAGRFDVRMIASTRELTCASRAGDYFLSAVQFSGLNSIGDHTPLHLYRLAAYGAGASVPAYDRSVDAATRPCFLDLIDGRPSSGQVVVESGADVKFVGWAADLKAGTVPQRVAVELVSPASGMFAFWGSRTERFDVAAAFSQPSLAKSGFEVQASTRGVPPGVYELRVRQVQGEQTLDCDSGRKLAIRR